MSKRAAARRAPHAATDLASLAIPDAASTAEPEPEAEAATGAGTARRPRGRPRKTLAELDDGNRRRELLHAAARLFRTRGYAATSTRDIAAAVGMQSGSPFYHFESKATLLYAVMEEGMRSALARQKSALQVGADPRERLASLIRVHFDILLGKGNDFIPVMLYEARSLNARQREGIAQLQRDYDAPWLPVLGALAAAGRLHGDPHLARLFILGALNWSVQWYDASKRATLDDLTRAALELFLQA